MLEKEASVDGAESDEEPPVAIKLRWHAAGHIFGLCGDRARHVWPNMQTYESGNCDFCDSPAGQSEDYRCTTACPHDVCAVCAKVRKKAGARWLPQVVAFTPPTVPLKRPVRPPPARRTHVHRCSCMEFR